MLSAVFKKKKKKRVNSALSGRLCQNSASAEDFRVRGPGAWAFRRFEFGGLDVGGPGGLADQNQPDCFGWGPGAEVGLGCRSLVELKSDVVFLYFLLNESSEA